MGTNDLTAAKAVVYSYIISQARNPTLEDGFFMGWELNFLKEYRRWVSTNQHANFYLFTREGFRESFVEDINYDFSLVSSAIILVCLYTGFFLGNFSPTHCRCVVALVGLLCVGISYASGFGFMYLCGGRTTGVHQLMPFLLIGIGVDDMFVLCNAIDQTDIKKPANERIIEALSHAGPAITITSLTNVLAFAFGATTSL